MQKFCKRAQKELAPILPSADKDSASRIQSSSLVIVEMQPVLFKFYAKITISFVTTSIFTKKILPKDFQGFP